jgi:UDPglucose--hexose-1-phosphate uridylyltransferase
MLRFDVTTNDWVIFAPSRAMRPDEFRQPRGDSSAQAAVNGNCPFCPGNEPRTPKEVYAIRGPGAGMSDWKVRVVPNKFPALRIEESSQRLVQGRFFRSMGGCGAHEVIVDSPDHARPLALQPVEQIVLLLRTMQDRFNDLMRDARFQAIVIFKNHGAGAGTSLGHPHCQLIATPVAPPVLRRKLAVATEYYDATGECLYSALLHEELAAGRRVLIQNDHYAAILPFASHVPFEIWILPRLRQSSFRWVDPSLLRPLAQMLKTVLMKLRVALGDPDFNLTIDAAPRFEEDGEYFLWHIRILPRLSTPAGFEMGSGMAINTSLPEDAADYLRAAPETEELHNVAVHEKNEAPSLMTHHA